MVKIEVTLLLNEKELSILEELVENERQRLLANPPTYGDVSLYGLDIYVTGLVRNSIWGE